MGCVASGISDDGGLRCRGRWFGTLSGSGMSSSKGRARRCIGLVRAKTKVVPPQHSSAFLLAEPAQRLSVSAYVYEESEAC